MWKSNEYDSRMCVQYEDKFMVNGLHDFYIPKNEQHGDIEQTFDEYQRCIETNLSSQISVKDKSKLLWFRDYFATEKKEAMKWALV